METGIAPYTSGWRYSFTDYLKYKLRHYVMSNATVCNGSLLTNKTAQSFVHYFSNEQISKCTSPEEWEDGLNKIPYKRLVDWIHSINNTDAFKHLAECDEAVLWKALYDYDGIRLLDAVENQHGISNLCTPFSGIYLPSPYSASTDCREYLLVKVPKEEIVEYLTTTMSDPDRNDILDHYYSNWPNDFANAVYKYFPECTFRSCAASQWTALVDGTDSSEIFNYLKDEKWTGILETMYSCKKDSFARNFAKVYPNYVAHLFENKHYPLIAFMEDIEAYFDAQMRSKLDGDTIIETQIARVNEFHIYGSSRLGILEENDTTVKAQRYYYMSRSMNDMEDMYWRVDTLLYCKIRSKETLIFGR